MKKIDQFLILLYKAIYIVAFTQFFLMVQSSSVVLSIILNIILLYLILLCEKTVQYFVHAKRKYPDIRNKYLNLFVRALSMFITFIISLAMVYLYIIGLYNVLLFLIVINIIFLLFADRLLFDFIAFVNYEKESYES